MAEAFLYILFFLMFGAAFNRIKDVETKNAALENENKNLRNAQRSTEDLVGTLIATVNQTSRDVAELRERTTH